jgi:hypothetical protein
MSNACRFCKKEYVTFFSFDFCSLDCKRKYESNLEDMIRANSQASTPSPYSHPLPHVVSSGSGGSTDGSSGGMGCFLFVVIISLLAMCDAATPDTNKAQTNRSVPQSSNSSGLSIPRSTCGDNNPVGIQDFYPVLVNAADQITLEHVRRNYCGDAFIRASTYSERRVIQVVSFLDKNRADDFVTILRQDPVTNSAEVGESTQN